MTKIIEGRTLFEIISYPEVERFQEEEMATDQSQQALKTDLVIVGGGIGGMVLALLAARRHLSVLVLDRRPEPTSTPFPTIIGPQGLALLDEIGLLEPLAKEDVYPCDVFRFYTIGGEKLLDADYRKVGLSCPRGWTNLIIPSLVLESLLIREFSCKEKGSLLWGAEFDSLINDNGVVRGVRFRHEGKTVEVMACLTVGADGKSSLVRQAASIPVKTRTARTPIMTLLVERPEGFHRDTRYYLGQGELLGLFPRSAKEMVIFYMNGGRRLETLQSEGIKRLTDRMIQIDPQLRPSLAPINQWASVRVAPCPTLRALKWGMPGLVLMGDAAHTLFPHVAQGVTQAMLDAFALADLLSKMNTDSERASRLPEQYEAIRRPPMEQLHKIAWEYHLLWGSPNPIVAALRNQIFRNTARSPRLLKKVIAIEGGLATGYTLRERLCAVTGLPLA